MRYYCIECEVPGGFGPETVMDHGVSRPIVRSLHFVFDGWLGDEILESTPCFIVTDGVAQSIRACKLTGVTFDTVRIERSDLFDEMYPDRVLPPFVWLKITGRPNADDFFMANNGNLVISDRALELLASVAHNAIITDYSR